MVQKKILDAGEQAVEREQQAMITRQKSKQPRISGADPDRFFLSILRWVKETDLEERPYQQDSRPRDAWLRTLWKRELHLAGVLNQVVLIDANRGWNLIGGRNQVIRYTNILHGFEEGEGWRHFIRLQALAFRDSDLGAVSEIGREGKNGPMRTLWYADPARCRLTGEIDAPLEYTPPNGKPQPWQSGDYFRLASMISTDETFYKLGFCAVSRAYEIAKTMIAIYRHDQEQLLAKMPRGLLLLQNISQDQWDDAMEVREAGLSGLEREYYGGVAILASAGIEQIDAKLLALSSLPKDFDRKVFTDLLMYAYALVMGYSPDEFWPVQGGSLGRGEETAIQHRKATSKGVLDFPVMFQEKLQGELPETVQMEFEERDIQGEMLDAQVQLAKANVVKAMYESGLQQGAPLIEREEARTLLVEQGLIPQDWTEQEEDYLAEDEDPYKAQEKTDMRRARYRSLPAVQRAAEEFPEEPIVRYSWPSNRLEVLWARGVDAFAGRFRRNVTYLLPKPDLQGTGIHRVRRQAQEEDPVLFAEGDVVIRKSDVDRAIQEGSRRISPEFGQVLDAEIIEPDEAT